MLISSSSILIDCLNEKVYQVAENYPEFVKFYCIKSIIKNTDSEIVVNVGYKAFGFTIRWTGIGKKIKNSSIIYKQTRGILKGMIARWNFYPIETKTKVSIDIELRGLVSLLGLLIKNRINSIINIILEDLKNTAEKDTAQCAH